MIDSIICIAVAAICWLAVYRAVGYCKHEFDKWDEPTYDCYNDFMQARRCIHCGFVQRREVK